MAAASSEVPAAGKRLIAVLHAVGPDSEVPESFADAVVNHLVQQADVAAESGADGFALVPAVLGIVPAMLNSAAEKIRAKYGESKYIIINYLADDTESIASIPAHADALWTDRGVDAKGAHKRTLAAKAYRDAHKPPSAWPGKWFAGFFHKGYDRRMPASDAELDALTNQVLEVADIPITTGEGTGVPINVEMLQRLHKSIAGRAPLAIASGVTVENVHGILPYCDYFVVGTGIEKEPEDPETVAFYKSAGIPAVQVGYLCPAKVAALAKSIHEYKPE